MALFKTLFGLTKKTTIDDNDIFALKDSTVSSGETDKNALATVLKTYFQGLLPDRITTLETYNQTEAVAEFNREATSSTRTITGATCYAASTTLMYFCFTWDYIPKQATTASFTYENLILRAETTLLRSFDGSETIGSPVINGKEVVIPVTLPVAISTSLRALDIASGVFKVILS